MTTHHLKIRTQWIERVIDGSKRAEVRKHDRDFQAGDLIEFTEVDARGAKADKYVDGEWVEPTRQTACILHVLDGRHADGILDDYCVLSIEYIGPVTA